MLGRRRQRAAERRARLLATAVQVSHAVGSTLDPIEVFRQVYRQVASVLSVDAFFVAIADAERTRLAYERAELHDRTARLSQRLFDLHRLGVELVTQRDAGALCRRLSASVGEMLHGRAAV